MPRWIVLAGVYVLVNISGIMFAGLLASDRVISPPDALDVVEFFAWGGPPLLAIGQVLLLARDKAKWYEWLVAGAIVAATVYFNLVFLYYAYAGV